MSRLAAARLPSVGCTQLTPTQTKTERLGECLHSSRENARCRWGIRQQGLARRTRVQRGQDTVNVAGLVYTVLAVLANFALKSFPLSMAAAVNV
jgi:hypothetical protein